MLELVIFSEILGQLSLSVIHQGMYLMGGGITSLFSSPPACTTHGLTAFIKVQSLSPEACHLAPARYQLARMPSRERARVLIFLGKFLMFA